MEGAEPGDCLVVDILDGRSVYLSPRDTWTELGAVTPFEKMPWGYTVELYKVLINYH